MLPIRNLMRLSMFARFSLVYVVVGSILLLWTRTVPAEVHLDGTQVRYAKQAYYIGADAESFAVSPTDFSRFTNPNTTDGAQFGVVMKQLGKPVLRLASLQRWDWRGEKETLALISGATKTTRTKVGYPYFSGKQYFEYCKANGIKTIPMLDVRYFYDADDGTVKKTSEHIDRAAAHYAAGYAKFIKAGKYDILFWEIGNEEYSESSYVSSEEYALITRAYIKAILAVEPNARFGIQLNIWKPEWNKWSQAVLQNLSGVENHINYIAYHFYNPVDYTNQITDEIVSFIKKFGFADTKLAITEWRHSWMPDIYDQTFMSASVYSRYLLFFIRHPDVEVSCIHAFPLFGGLAEWSNGSYWTSFIEGAVNRRRDTSNTPRWRVLPFGHAQKMIQDVIHDGQLMDFSERPGKFSSYLFNRKEGGYALVLVNESSSEVSEQITIKSPIRLASVEGKELFSENPDAIPRDMEPQPWSVKPISTAAGSADLASGSIALLGNGNAVEARLRPFSVVTLELH